MTGDWRVMVADTVTGVIMADVVPRDMPSFSRNLTDKGTWTVNVMPDDPGNASLDLHALTDAGRFSWIVLHDDFITQAGPVWTYQFDENTRNLSVSGTGIQGIFDRRVLRNPSGPVTDIADAGNDLNFNGVTLRLIAREIVTANLAQTGYGLPIDGLPSADPGSHDRTYRGYDVAKVWDRLDELSKVINGPELDFRPYLVAGNQIRWEMLIGNPTLGDQNSLAVWDYGGALGQIDIDVNGSASPCTRVWVKGSGSENTTVFGFAESTTLIGLGFPPTDFVDVDHSGVTVQATATGYAQADLVTFGAPVETWKCSARIDGATSSGVAVSPALGLWALGDAPTFGVSGHPWLPDGQYRRRILGYDSKDQSTVDLTVQPVPEVI